MYGDWYCQKDKRERKFSSYGDHKKDNEVRMYNI